MLRTRVRNHLIRAEHDLVRSSTVSPAILRAVLTPPTVASTTRSMQHYYGWKEIGPRLGIKHSSSLSKFITRTGFPVYYKKRHNRNLLYTNEALVLQWELQQASLYRQRKEAKRLERAEYLRNWKQQQKNVRSVA